MSELLRNHIQDLGLKHADIAQRARTLNQTTTYRVVEGDTQNPSINSITSIIEAICITDADARVLYQKFGTYHAKPRCFVKPHGSTDFASIKIKAHNLLNRGEIQKASRYVMAMFDLAHSDEEFSIAYEQAGIVYLGLGRWEEAQVNFEAADAHLHCNIDNPDIPQNVINRKHTIMTNIGTLMVKRKNINWAMVLARSIIEHPRVSDLNKGWGWLIMGESHLDLDEAHQALDSFQYALDIFTQRSSAAVSKNLDDSQEQNRKMQQAKGNMRWTQIHLLKAKHLAGDASAHHELRELEIEWREVDPEASTMSGLFFAELIPHQKKRTLLLKALLKIAKEHHLGEIIQKISALLMILLFINFGLFSYTKTQPPTIHSEFSAPKNTSGNHRGNTGS